jgi:hypothetical protein
MTSSESEAEPNLPDDDDDDVEENTSNDDDMWDNTDDNFMNDMYDDDDLCDFNDAHHFSSLLDSLLEATEPGLPQTLSAGNASNYHGRSAMGLGSHTLPNSNILLPTFGDSITSYLSAPPLCQKATSSTPFTLSYDPTSVTSGSNTSLSAKLFVGNVPRGSTELQLKEYFDSKDYAISRVILTPHNVSINIYLRLMLLILKIVKFF